MMMSPQVHELLTGATGTGAGSAYKRQTTGPITFQANGTFVATVQFQGSLDNTNWVTLASATDTTPNYVVEKPYPYVRANVSAYTSGSLGVLCCE